jgi:hypothetical protein
MLYRETSMTMKENAEALASAATAYVRHGALWMIGAVTEAQQEWAALTADNPMVQQAQQVALAYAAAHGVPVAEVEAVGSSVLALAREIACAAPKQAAN